MDAAEAPPVLPCREMSLFARLRVRRPVNRSVSSRCVRRSCRTRGTATRTEMRSRRMRSVMRAGFELIGEVEFGGEQRRKSRGP